MHYEHIKNSPKTVNVVAGTDPNASYAYGPGLEDGILDTLPTEFFIQAADRNGNKMDKGGDDFDVDIKDADGNDVPHEIEDKGDGTYKVNYKPNGPGPQKVNVNLRGKPIKDAPFTVKLRLVLLQLSLLLKTILSPSKLRLLLVRTETKEVKTLKLISLDQTDLLKLLKSTIREMANTLSLTLFLM